MKRSIYLVLSYIALQCVTFGSVLAMTKITEDSEFGTITISRKDMVIIATAKKMHNERTAFFTSMEKIVGSTDFCTHSYQFNPNAPDKTQSPIMIRRQLIQLLKRHIAAFEKEQQENLLTPVQTFLRRTKSYVDQSTLIEDREVEIELAGNYMEQWRPSSPALVDGAEGRLILSQSN